MRSYYYDISPLLSKRDSRGEKPEIFMAVTNRLGGKTYAFSRLLLRRYLKDGKPRGLLIRWNGQLRSRAGSFALDVMQKDPAMRGHSLHAMPMDGICYAIRMDDRPDPCIYVMAINDAEKIRENSARFSEIQEYYMDEFQAETDGYVPQEIKKFQSIHTSIARGGQGHTRYVPVYMASNAASKINPYFVAFGIHKKPVGKQEFINGPGWVLQQCVIESARDELQESGFNQAFEDQEYGAFASNNEYLLDDSRFIGKIPIINGKQMAILESRAGKYGLWQLPGGVYYISPKHDPSGLFRVAVDRSVQGPGNTSATAVLAPELKKAYDLSLVRFADADCYAAFMCIFTMDFF